jgi:hypothetical protein
MERSSIRRAPVLKRSGKYYCIVKITPDLKMHVFVEGTIIGMDRIAFPSLAVIIHKAVHNYKNNKNNTASAV